MALVSSIWNALQCFCTWCLSATIPLECDVNSNTNARTQVPRDEALSNAFEKMKENKDLNMLMTCGEKEEAFFHDAIDKDKKNSFPNMFGRSVVVKHPTGHEFPLKCRDGEDTLHSLSLFLKNQ